VKMCRRNGLQIVCVVRKAAQAKELNALGVEYIVDTSVDGWEAQLRDLCTKLQCRLGFEAVGGTLTGQVLSCMPARSELYVYGDLAGRPIDSLHVRNFIFDDKQLKGFWLNPYLKDKSLLYKINLSLQVAALLATDLSTNVRASFSLERVADAVALYKSDMGAGKTVIAPHQREARTDYPRADV